MLSLDEALALIKNVALILPAEVVGLTECNNRVLAEDVFSDTDMPPFDKSAMDGYACRRVDLSNELKISDTIHAGDKAIQSVKPGTCIKIMTGAPIPEKADTVIMFEDTMLVDNNTVRLNKKSGKNNICYRGEDVKKGDRVLIQGTLLLPHHIAMLAAVGKKEIRVNKLPKVALASTGSELVEPDRIPEQSQIRNSNAYNLMAQLDSVGIKGNYTGIIKDDKKLLFTTIHKLLDTNDILVLTGGASAGVHDYVPKILAEIGMTLQFNRIAIQPGKPLSFASSKGKFCFGLSGNPVSSYLQFELLVKPFIYQLMGHNYNYPIILIPLSEGISRNKADRLKFFPVILTNKKKVSPIDFHGSAHIAGLINANGFGLFPKDKLKISAGESLEVLLIK